MKYYANDYKIGLCFKIYVHNNTSIERYNIIQDFLSSLNKILNHYKNLVIVGVIDCCPTDRLNTILHSIDTRINIINLNKNKGISFATNIGIEYLLNQNCDVLFCSDDDIIFLNNDVLNIYIKRMVERNIPHLGYYSLKTATITYPPIKSGNLCIINGFSGVFYSILSTAVYRYGYLPVLKKKYGYEHEMLSKTLTRYQFDMIDSNKYIELNQLSIVNTSGQSDINDIVTYCPLEHYVSSNYYNSSI